MIFKRLELFKSQVDDQSRKIEIRSKDVGSSRPEEWLAKFLVQFEINLNK